MAVGMIIAFGAVIHFIEPEQFPTLFEGIWWAIITASTVGYGDYVPATLTGKIAGILLILAGAGFLTTYFVSLATTAVSRQNSFEEGKVAFKGNGHFIIVGWNERSREVIKSLETIGKPIILIDETLEKLPNKLNNLHFIKGRSSIDEVLVKANVYDVEKVVITADQNLNEIQADMSTILTLIAVKGLNPNAICIVEILTKEQMPNAKRAGADEIIETNSLSSLVIQNSLKSENFSCPLHHLLDKIEDSRLLFQPPDHEIVSLSFRQAAKLMLEKNWLLIGVKRGEDTFVNPPGEFDIKLNDLLLLISE